MKKKSGAAQRLISLVLALGLIFTLAPASVFAGDEVPVSSTVTAIADEEPVVDTTEPVVDTTEPAVDNTEPAVDNTEPVVDGTEPVVDGTEPVVDGTEPVVDGTEPAVDGTEPAVDGTESAVDGTEPAVEEELSSQQTALLAASVPAVMSNAPAQRGYGDVTFQFTDDGNQGINSIAYAHHTPLIEHTDFTVMNGSSVTKQMLISSKIVFFVDVKEGYTVTGLTGGAGEITPLATAEVPGNFENDYATALQNGYDYVFVFSGKQSSPVDITIKTEPLDNTCEVKVNDGVLTDGAYFYRALPQTVKKGESLTVTLYGPNEAGIGRLLSSLTVEDGEGGKHVSLKIPMNTEGTATRNALDNATITVKYLGTNIENGLYRAKYEITLENIQDDITFVGLTTREWMKKAVVIHELEGISELEYKGIDGEWTDVDVSSVADGLIEIEFDNYGVLDKEFWEGHFSVINIRYKVAEDYENPQLTLLRGKIQKDPKPDAEGWYTFDITIGRVNSHDDIEVWVDSDEYYVDMRLTAEKTTTTTYPAKFYVHEAGSNVYYPVGDGTVDFGKPTWEYEENPIKLNDNNKDKVIEPSPLVFNGISVDDVFYEYSATAGVPNTYTFEGWDVAKTAYLDQSGPDAIWEWHVDGIIVLYKALPDAMKPVVADFEDVYDGTAKTLSITYPDGKTEDDYTIEYQDANGNWVVGNPTLTNVDKLANIKIRFTMEGYVPYEAPGAYTLEVTERPLTLTVQDVTILKGETPTFTVIPSAEGENTGLLTSLGHTLTDDWEVNKDYDNEVAREYTITLMKDSWVIKDAAGKNVSNNYSVTPVAGKLTVKAPLPAALQPTVGNTSSTYDGQAHGLYISYPDGTSASDYKVEYQIAGGAWSETAPSLTNVDKVENVKVRFTYGNYATYEAPGVYSVEVTKRPLTLKVNDDKITDGEPIPSFTYAITAGSVVSGQSITGVTYGGYTDELGIYDVTIKTFKIVAGGTDVTGNYDVTLLPGVFTIGTSGGGGTTPTPNPNPNPTPVPVEPETPVTPVAPVTPDEEEEEPAEVEDIEDEETPQASPDTDADKEEDKTENIEDEETAQAGAPGEGNWALLNLILMVLTVVAGLAMLALRFARKTGMAHLLGIVPAIVALVAFFVTEDMSLPMAMTDKWTLIMALIAVVQVVLLVLGRNGAQEDDQPREQY